MKRFLFGDLLACLFVCISTLGTPHTFAAEAVPLAADPVLEARVMRLSVELRCLVCQNQTIADSHAGLAVDLKNQIREQLSAGRSESQVLAYMVERYGDFESAMVWFWHTRQRNSTDRRITLASSTASAASGTASAAKVCGVPRVEIQTNRQASRSPNKKRFIAATP